MFFFNKLFTCSYLENLDEYVGSLKKGYPVPVESKNIQLIGIQNKVRYRSEFMFLEKVSLAPENTPTIFCTLKKILSNNTTVEKMS